MSGRVDWFERDVRVQLANAVQAMVDEAAFLIEGQTKVNITNNGQVDTGFMRNSVYAVTPLRDTAATAAASARAANPSEETAPARQAPADGAVVAVGAGYAIYNEQRIPFLYPAAETVASQYGGAIVTAGREAL